MTASLAPPQSWCRAKKSAAIMQTAGRASSTTALLQVPNRFLLLDAGKATARRVPLRSRGLGSGEQRATAASRASRIARPASYFPGLPEGRALIARQIRTRSGQSTSEFDSTPSRPCAHGFEDSESTRRQQVQRVRSRRRIEAAHAVADDHDPCGSTRKHTRWSC